MADNGAVATLRKKLMNKVVGLEIQRVDQLLANPANFRVHPAAQQAALAGSVDEIGFIDPVIVNKNTGHVVDGHLRVVLAMRSGEEALPVVIVDLSEEEEKKALLMLDPIAAMAATDKEQLQATLQAVSSDDERIQQMLSDLAEKEGLYKPEKPEGKPNPRILPLDVIYTLQGADVTCCLAVLAGLKYGIQSATFRLCPYTDKLSGRHDVAFIDNDYFNYDHTRHLSVVQQFKPKYATVRDAMTKAQCEKAGIAYYPLEQILDWADELSEAAGNVIVIPKYEEALDLIPERFMLGYSVPTSHGGTPLPVEMFKGRRVHLLGGSWKAQLAHMAVLGDDVVSVDNNQIALMADKWGQFTDPEGETQQVKEILPMVNNQRYVALAISFGSIAAKVNELYAASSVTENQIEETEIGHEHE